MLTLTMLRSTKLHQLERLATSLGVPVQQCDSFAYQLLLAKRVWDALVRDGAK